MLEMFMCERCCDGASSARHEAAVSESTVRAPSTASDDGGRGLREIKAGARAWGGGAGTGGGGGCRWYVFAKTTHNYDTYAVPQAITH